MVQVPTCAWSVLPTKAPLLGEMLGCSVPFMTWLPNIHSSLFYNTYRFMVEHGNCNTIQAVVKSYRLYLEHVELQGSEAVLGLTRAWTLVRFFDSGMLQMTPCSRCGGHFVAHAHDPKNGVVCGLCQPPSRAGKTRKTAEASEAAVAEDAELVG